MKFTRLIAAALATLTVAGAVVMSSSGVVHAHHGNIEGVPRCTDSGWAVDWRLWVTENRDVWKVSEAGWQPGDEWLPVRPTEMRSRTKTTTHSFAETSAVQASVDVTWGFTDSGGTVIDEFVRPIDGLTVQRPEDCVGPQPTTVAWTPTDGTCANPGGSLVITFDASQVDYSGSPAGAYAPGTSVTGSFTSKPGFVIDGEDGPFSHTFAVTGAPCEDRIEPPQLVAAYDCVSGTSSYTLTPASSPTWTAGAVTLSGTTYTVTITANAGYTFGTPSVTLTASFTVDDDCEHTVVAPEVTPPTCFTPGSVKLPTSESYTWTTNTDGTYTAVPSAGVKLLGTTTFGPFDLAQLTGEACQEPRIDVAAFAPVCQADVPFISYRIGVSGTPNTTADLTFIDNEGDVVATHNDVPLVGTVIYPGASVSPQDWPGWKFQNNQWVPDPTDDNWRQGLTVRVEVNPTAIGQVSYPPATDACNGPDETESQGPTTTTGPTTQLPATGTDSTTTATTWALLLVAGGGALTLLGRRSRSATHTRD